MADFDIRDIAALKVKLQIIEKLVLADWILIILSMYYDWGGWITCLIVIQIILYIYKSKLRKQLKQKEYLAKVVEERTIELRIQRDQVLNESRNYPDALDALAKAQDELVRKGKTGYCRTIDARVGRPHPEPDQLHQQLCRPFRQSDQRLEKKTLRTSRRSCQKRTTPTASRFSI